MTTGIDAIARLVPYSVSRFNPARWRACVAFGGFYTGSPRKNSVIRASRNEEKKMPDISSIRHFVYCGNGSRQSLVFCRSLFYSVPAALAGCLPCEAARCILPRPPEFLPPASGTTGHSSQPAHFAVGDSDQRKLDLHRTHGKTSKRLLRAPHHRMHLMMDCRLRSIVRSVRVQKRKPWGRTIDCPQ